MSSFESPITGKEVVEHFADGFAVDVEEGDNYCRCCILAQYLWNALHINTAVHAGDGEYVYTIHEPAERHPEPGKYWVSSDTDLNTVIANFDHLVCFPVVPSRIDLTPDEVQGLL